MKIKLTLTSLFGTHDIVTNRADFVIGNSYQMRITGAVIVDERSDEETSDAYGVGLTEIHTAAFRPHLDGNIKRVELNLEGTKPTAIHHRPTALRHLELLDRLVASAPRDEMGRVIINVDGHRFQREEIRSIINGTMTKRVWFAIAGNGEGGEAGEKAKSINELSPRQLDLIELYVRIGEETDHKLKEVPLIRSDRIILVTGQNGRDVCHIGGKSWQNLEDELKAGGEDRFNSSANEKEILIAGKAKFIKRYSSTTTTPEWLASFDESEKTPMKESIDLVALHKIIKELHPKRDKVELYPSLEKTKLNSDRHKVIPEVIEALEEETRDGVSNMLGETSVRIQGARYMRLRKVDDSVVGRGSLVWYAQLD